MVGMSTTHGHHHMSKRTPYIQEASTSYKAHILPKKTKQNKTTVKIMKVIHKMVIKYLTYIVLNQWNYLVNKHQYSHPPKTTDTTTLFCVISASDHLELLVAITLLLTSPISTNYIISYSSVRIPNTYIIWVKRDTLGKMLLQCVTLNDNPH